jgi:S-formylglutathione hydrolase FrmB
VPARANVAGITAERQVDARVIELTISTPAFATPTKVEVDLPVGYDADPTRRWPVTYYVAGTNHHYADFNQQYDGERLTRSFPSIVVSPNGNSGYWSDWYNGGAFGPPMYETYVIDQLIPLIDARFRTIADRSRRAVLGESMGGFGAMMFAARHPDRFVAAASLSGAVDSNLPANGAVLSASSSLDGGPPDGIYGPRSTQEVRWRGHNPTDLAENLRGVDLQVRTAGGTLDSSIGEGPADIPSCPIEIGVHMASVDLHEQLDGLHVPHLWRDYGAGCHSVPNFERQISDALPVFARVFAHPQPAPTVFNYMSIEPHFEIWGWHVDADPARALEFLRMQSASRSGLTLAGSGTTTVTTPPLFPGLRLVDVSGGHPPSPRRTQKVAFASPSISARRTANSSTPRVQRPPWRTES